MVKKDRKSKNKNVINTEETFKQGVGGGILGAFVGAPGIGMAAGMLHANRDKLQDMNQSVSQQKLQNKKNKKDPLYNFW